jgi:sugar phosphate isomerase/epimerase
MALAAALKPHGVMLGIEIDATASAREDHAMSFIASFDALVQLVKMCVGDNIGVVADLWQIHVGGGDVEQLGLLSAKEIAAVILSDIASDVPLDQASETHRLLPGETGVIDTVRALTVLAEMGYDGPISPRADRAGLGESGRDTVVKNVAERINDLWTQAGLNSKGRLAAPVRN